MISPEEEIELARQSRSGGPKAQQAKDRLVLANLRFVVSVAKQYQHRGMTLSDLINEGNIGLVKAAEKFDETRGFKFISYAVWWIRQSIIQAMADQGRLIRMPQNHIVNLGILNQAIADFEQQHSRKPTPEELAEITDIAAEKIGTALQLDEREMSLDMPIGEDSGMVLSDMISDSDEDMNPEAHTYRESATAEVRTMLGKLLPERDFRLMCEYYGIGCQRVHVEELCDRYGLTRERVRQIRERCILKLRKNKDVRRLSEYLG